MEAIFKRVSRKIQMFYILIISFCLVISACQSKDTVNESSSSLSEEKLATKEDIKQLLEPISNPDVFEGAISFASVSNGCTRAADFKIIQISEAHGTCELAIYRVKPDYCKKAPQLIDIKLEWNRAEACEGAEVGFINPRLPTAEIHYHNKREL